MQSIFQNAFSNPQDEPENTTISAYQSLPKPSKDTVGLTFTDPFQWAVGIFEGEGCLTYIKPNDAWEMKVTMTDMDVLWSFYEAIGFEGNLNGLRKSPSQKEHHKPWGQWKTGKRDLINELVIRMYPYLHERRRGKCNEFFAWYHSKKK